ALAHLVPGDRGSLAGLLVHPRQRAQRRLLPGLPLGALHELVHHDRPALVPRPQREPERGAGLALHLPAVHHEQRAVPPLPRRQPVVRNHQRLARRHQATSLCRPGRVTPLEPPAGPRPCWPGGATPLEPPGGPRPCWPWRIRTESANVPAARCSRRSTAPPRDSASPAARPSRTGPDSQSATTLCTPAAASRAAARCALATGSGPPVARPAVTRTSSGRRPRSRGRAARGRGGGTGGAGGRPPAGGRPAASGVRPPVGSAASRAAAASTENVGGSATSAAPPRNVTMPTLSLRW